MTEHHLKQLAYTLMLVGMVSVAIGLSLAVFTDIVLTHGIEGVTWIAVLIAAGLMLSIPAKLYLTYLLMKPGQQSGT